MPVNIKSFSQMNQRTRILLVALVCVLIVGVCFQLIDNGPLQDLKASQAELQELQGMSNDIASYQQILKTQSDALKQAVQTLDAFKDKCFTSDLASTFVEQVNVWATEYHCTPISRVVETFKHLPKQEVTPIQPVAIKMVLQGHYKDVVAFMKRLYDRPQKIVITDCHIGLPPGENQFPRASFRIVLFVRDMQEDITINQEP